MSDSRRVKITKKLIKDALIELLSKKTLNKISIKEICELADVNRSTFYSYYENTFFLLDEIENDLINDIPHKSDLFNTKNNNEMLDIFVAYFNYIKEHEFVFKVLLIDSDNINFRRKLLSNILDKRYEEHYENKDTRTRYKFIYTANGIISMIIQWIEEDFPISTKEMADIALFFAIDGRK